MRPRTSGSTSEAQWKSIATILLNDLAFLCPLFLSLYTQISTALRPYQRGVFVLWTELMKNLTTDYSTENKETIEWTMTKKTSVSHTFHKV